MPASLHFRSYRSNSAGNCVALWGDRTCVLFDCGVATLRDCRDLIRRQQARSEQLTLVVSHAHRDHLSAQALRTMSEAGVPIRCHRDVLAQLQERHGFGAAAPVRAFGDEGLTTGEFQVTPLALRHAPGVPTFGFVVRTHAGANSRTVVVATDFCESSPLVPHLRSADFVFIEANHDLELLRKRFNYASQWHSSNARTASLLVDALGRSSRPPGNVVLGHLSEERNDDKIAVKSIRQEFGRRGMRVEFELETAPKYEASRVIRIL
jgi:phosphoribosyl 1,2-cyclic phosphodiesterase